MADALLDALAPFRAEPHRSALLTDFDGTLAPIVSDPAEARPLPGAADVLDDLARGYALVAVVSGRPVDFLQRFFGPTVVLAGLYGLEWIVAGVRHDHPLGGVWREVVGDVAAHAEAAGPDGMVIESKGLSLTLHYRGRPEREAEIRAWGEQQAALSGLVIRPAKMSYELHPPIEVDKGSTLLELVGGLGAVAFIGDDVGDLPAFDALDRLDADGVATLRVGVRSAESAPVLLDRADRVVDGPAGVLAVLDALVRR